MARQCSTLHFVIGRGAFRLVQACCLDAPTACADGIAEPTRLISKRDGRRPRRLHSEERSMVKKIVTEAINLPMQRRDFLKSASALGVAGAFPAIITRRAFAAGNPTVVNSIRSLSNPYHATWNQGGQAFAKSIGAEYVTLVTEGDSEKGIADIRAILAKTGGNMVLNVDPNDSPDARPIVEACVKAGAYVPPNDIRKGCIGVSEIQALHQRKPAPAKVQQRIP